MLKKVTNSQASCYLEVCEQEGFAYLALRTCVTAEVHTSRDAETCNLALSTSRWRYMGEGR